MYIKINEKQRLMLLAALDLYEGDENTSISDSSDCAEIEEVLRACVWKDVMLIRKHVKVWPEGATSVRLDRDGEICFMNAPVSFDFYPSGYDISMFRGKDEDSVTGVQYTRGDLGI